MLLGHFTKVQKWNVVQLAKQQVKQVSFSHSSERQQGVRISYLGGRLFQARTAATENAVMYQQMS